MMPHSSQGASCGARPRNWAWAVCFCQFLLLPGSSVLSLGGGRSLVWSPGGGRSLVLSPGGENGARPDQYQYFRGPVTGSRKAAACISYCSAVSPVSWLARSQRTPAVTPNARTASTAAHTRSGIPEVITYGR